MIKTDKVIRYAKELSVLNALLDETNKYSNKTLIAFYKKRINEINNLLEQHLGD
jgi:hypothetical protein